MIPSSRLILTEVFAESLTHFSFKQNLNNSDPLPEGEGGKKSTNGRDKEGEGL